MSDALIWQVLAHYIYGSNQSLRKSVCWSDPHVNVECCVGGVFLASRMYQFPLTAKLGERIMTYK